MPEPIPTDFEKLLGDAALQYYFMRVRRFDQEMEREGWTTRYVIDSHILDLHLDPARIAKESAQLLIASGMIFSDDPLDLQELVTAALGQFVCYGLEAGAPLLILPPLDIEFRHAISAYQRRAEEALDGHPGHKAKLASIRDRICAEGHAITTDDLREFRQALLLAMHPHEQLRRLAALFRHNRLAHAHSPLNPGAFSDPFRKVMRHNQADHARTLDVLEYKTAWLKRFPKPEGSKRPLPLSKERDAEALARLQVYNAELSRHKCRLVLITMDNAVFDASQSLEMPNEFRLDHRTSSFYDLYVRHPRAFMDERGVLTVGSAGQPEREKTLFDWLQVLLLDGPLGDPRDFRIKGGRIVAQVPAGQSIARVPDDLLSSVATRWRTMSEQFISMAGEPEILANLPKKAAGPGVREAIESALSTFNVQGAATRYEFIYVGNGVRVTYEAAHNAATPLREVKSPLFEGRPELSAFLRGLKGMFRESPVDLPKIWDYVSAKDSALRNEDARINSDGAIGYSQDMGFSYLMALFGQWRTAATVCRRALAYARDPDALVRSNGSNGREAWLFLAHCERHVAASPAQLDACLGYLAKAEHVSKIEIEQFQEFFFPYEHDTILQRIAAERLAIKYQSLLLGWHRSSETERISALLQMRPLIQDFLRLRQDIEAELEQIATEMANQSHNPWPPEMASADDRRSIRRNLVVRSCRNILAIGLLEPRPTDEVRRASQRAWEDLLLLKNDPEWKEEAEPRSKFSQMLMLCSQAKFSPDPSLRSNARDILRKRRLEFVSLDGLVYDSVRNNEIINLSLL